MVSIMQSRSYWKSLSTVAVIRWNEPHSTKLDLVVPDAHMAFSFGNCAQLLIDCPECSLGIFGIVMEKAGPRCAEMFISTRSGLMTTHLGV